MAPKEIAPHLEHFIQPWCLALRPIRDDVEKEHAFLGLCAMLRLNPQVRIPCFSAFYTHLASMYSLQAVGESHLKFGCGWAGRACVRLCLWNHWKYSW